MDGGMQHIGARKRLYKHLEPFPSKSAGKRFLDYLMYAVGILQPIALVPQILTIYVNKSAASISLSTWLLLAIFNTMWFVYGLVHKEKPIWISNLLLTLFDLAIVIGVLYY